jgi:hypothetical protein
MATVDLDALRELLLLVYEYDPASSESWLVRPRVTLGGGGRGGDGGVGEAQRGGACMQKPSVRAQLGARHERAHRTAHFARGSPVSSAPRPSR